MHRCPPSRRPAGRKPSFWLALALIALSAPIAAGTREDAPEGLPAGRVVFLPWFEEEVLADDNLFRRAETQNPESDVETVVTVGVDAIVPFRMSRLTIGYEGAGFFYKKDNVDNTESHEGNLELELNTSNHHAFVIDGLYNRGVTQRQTIDDNLEIVRQGIPLIRRDFGFTWSREVAQRPSWSARFEQSDQTYQTVASQPWVDYDGWTFAWNYGQPIYRRGFLSARADVRRVDQFQSGLDSTFTDPIRRERYDGIEVGFRGLVGRNQPLYLSLGYGHLQYTEWQIVDPAAPPREPTDYRGLVGTATWRLPVGGSSNLRVSALRRPLSSFYNTYYLINELRVRFDRPVGQGSRYGLTTLYSKNRYGDVAGNTITGFTAGRCAAGALTDPDIARKDDRKQIEAFWDWYLQPRMALRFTAGHNRRDSNCETGFGAYTSNSIGVTVRVGWFD